MNIGFIGLGIMGQHMSKNLLNAGYKLEVYDINEESVVKLVQAGAVAGKSSADVAAHSDVIITMLPNSPHVEAVVMGKQGILESVQRGTVLIDMSSIAPLASQRIAKACEEKGVRMLDAPVSGGEPKAIDGSLSIMVGGEESLFEQVKDILLCMGSSAVYCGTIGAGNTTKLANQIIVALNIAACAEAFTFVKKAGVDPELVYSAIRNGLAGSTVMDAKVPMMIQGNYKPGFKIDLHIKDLNNVMDTGHGLGTPLPLSAQVMEMLQTLHADGFGQNDHSGLAKYYEKILGITIAK